MQFDFDTVVERRGTNSLKYDFAKERGKDENVLPLWRGKVKLIYSQLKESDAAILGASALAWEL